MALRVHEFLNNWHVGREGGNTWAKEHPITGKYNPRVLDKQGKVLVRDLVCSNTEGSQTVGKITKCFR